MFKVGDRVDWTAAAVGWTGENCVIEWIDGDKAKLDWLRHPVPLSELVPSKGKAPAAIVLIELPPPVPFSTQPIPEPAEVKPERREFTVNIQPTVKAKGKSKKKPAPVPTDHEQLPLAL